MSEFNKDSAGKNDFSNDDARGSRPNLNTLLIAIVVILGIAVIVYFRS
jgi:hypothetical protein